jgi:hypothetical protein
MELLRRCQPAAGPQQGLQRALAAKHAEERMASAGR